ncbi:uncharacterized protein At4g22758-like [Primulina tabacum]|uniref:uncharacterized protein At4g22758-like n=1 Tax=Primulina tabacum TaxID=48773 RepID=UPI003F5A1EAF
MLTASHATATPPQNQHNHLFQQARFRRAGGKKTNYHGTPRSSQSSAVRQRIKPAADRKFLEPSKYVSILKRSKSEPSLLKGVGGSETEAVEKVSAEEDERVLFRPVTWVDIFTSPEISTPRFPRKCYQKDAKVVVNVTVEGSAGPIQTLVKLGSNVEETINLVIIKYNEEGRIPPLDKHSASTCQLHQSYFSLQSLSKSDLIGDTSCRSLYLRKYSCSDEHNANSEEDISNSSYQVNVELNSSGSRSIICYFIIFLPQHRENYSKNSKIL